MNEKTNNVIKQLNENPVGSMVVIAAAGTAIAKIIDAVGRYRGSSAYAKDVNRRVKKDKKRK